MYLDHNNFNTPKLQFIEDRVLVAASRVLSGHLFSGGSGIIDTPKVALVSWFFAPHPKPALPIKI